MWELHPFTWPRLRMHKEPQIETVPRLTLCMFWRCQLCTRALPKASTARSHRCEQLPDRLIKARLKNLRTAEETAAKLRHSINSETLRRTFEEARRLLGGDPWSHDQDRIVERSTWRGGQGAHVGGYHGT